MAEMYSKLCRGNMSRGGRRATCEPGHLRLPELGEAQGGF